MKYITKKKKIIFSVLCSCSLFIVLVSCGINDMSIKNKVDDRIQVDKYVAVGILNENQKIIDNGSNIIFEDKTVNHIVSLEQKDDTLKEYMLIILEDFKQINFKVNGKEHNKYSFELNKVDNIDIKVELNLSTNASELIYLILPQPNQELINLSLEKQLSLQNIFVSRFRLNDSNKKIEYINNPKSFNDEIITEFFMSNSKNELKMFTEINENNDIYMTMGNPNSVAVDYAIIAFKDWNQSNISSSEFIKYVSIEANSVAVEIIKAPKVEEDTVMQFIAFPLPYKTEKEIDLSTQGFASCRFKVSEGN